MTTGANGQAVELLLIGGRMVEVDVEIAPIVAALNDAGFPTRASCSGHGYRPANIALSDGREIIIARNHAEGRLIDRLFPIDINGNAASGIDTRSATDSEAGVVRKGESPAAESGDAQ